MKLFFSKKVYQEIDSLKQSEDYRALVMEVRDVFMPGDREMILATLNSKSAEFEPIRKKNWSIYAEGDNFVLEMDDEFFTIFMDAMKTQWKFAKTLIRPIKVIFDLAVAFGAHFKEIEGKFDRFFNDTIDKEDNVNPT